MALSTRRPRRSQRANPGRTAAARCLVAIEEGAFAEDALARLAPTGRDRGLTWHLVLGVLQRRRTVDAALRPVLSQPMSLLEPEVRAVLRIGTYERVLGGTAPHAAVSQGVEVVASLGKRRAKGLVNAVLRRVRLPDDLSRGERLDHPDWLIERWTERFGEEAVDAWCRDNNTPAPLTVALCGEPPREAWEEAGVAFRPAQTGDRTLGGAWTLEGWRGPITELPGFERGWVQDAAAAAVADEAEGEHVLDACAAPGGKTFRLVANGHRVTSVDRSGDRLERLREGLERLKMAADVHVHDWREGPHPTLGQFASVVVDAPCTALGTLRRHPEIRWRRQPDEPARARTTQLDVLEATRAHVAPGGCLVYAVCSPEPEEGEECTAAFLRRHSEFTLESAWCSAPPTHGEDAFYAARLRLS